MKCFPQSSCRHLLLRIGNQAFTVLASETVLELLDIKHPELILTKGAFRVVLQVAFVGNKYLNRWYITTPIFDHQTMRRQLLHHTLYIGSFFVDLLKDTDSVSMRFSSEKNVTFADMFLIRNNAMTRPEAD